MFVSNQCHLRRQY